MAVVSSSFKELNLVFKSNETLKVVSRKFGDSSTVYKIILEDPGIIRVSVRYKDEVKSLWSTNTRLYICYNGKNKGSYIFDEKKALKIPIVRSTSLNLEVWSGNR